MSNSRHKILPIESLPEVHGDMSLLRITNGGSMHLEDGRWKSQRSRHGRIIDVGGELEYLSVDRTRYIFNKPDLRLILPSISLEDFSFIPKDKRLKIVKPKKNTLFLEPALAFAKPAAQWLKTVIDQNDNVFSYLYTDSSFGPMLSKTIDAVGREFHFEYTPSLPKLDGEGYKPLSRPYRLSRVRGLIIQF